jgi:biotin carboxyl carrier protein
MKLWVTLAGRDAEVDLRTDGDRMWLEIEGKRLEADFHPLPDGEVYSLIVNGRSHVVRVASAGEGLEVSLRGATIPVEVRHPIEKRLKSLAKTGGKSGGETLIAPMPGVVVAIRVRPGDVVAAGQAVIVVEAMKMQNELAARHGGVVAEILVGEKSPVAAGQPLVRLKAAT